MAEMRGFIFALIFIVVFAGLLSATPTGLLGLGETPENLTPLDPSIISGYSDTENYSTAVFTPIALGYEYVYPELLGGYEYIIRTVGDVDYFYLGSKVLIGGVLWLGTLAYVEFVSPSGENYGINLDVDDIDNDMDNGTVTYTLFYQDSGASAGGLSIYYNASLYSDIDDAWDNNALYFLHGVGLAESATANIGSLLVSLLLLQLPDVPVLLNLLIATPIWACIIYVLWFIIKEMIPFV